MSTPPPVNHSLQPTGTPIHTRSGTTDRYDVKYENRHQVLSRLADEMGPFIVGPMASQAFLYSFLPPPPAGSSVPLFTEGMFSSFIDVLEKTELQWYDVFVSSDSCHLPCLFLGLILPFQIPVISPHLKNLAIVKTANAKETTPLSSFPFSQRPDCSVYTDCSESMSDREKYVDFSRVEFVIEFKRHDPFHNPVPVHKPGPSVDHPAPVHKPGPSVDHPAPVDKPGPSVDHPAPVDRPGPSVDHPASVDNQGQCIDHPASVDNQGQCIDNPVPVDGSGLLIDNPDPSVDNSDLSANDPSSGEPVKNPFLSSKSTAGSILGQLTAYATSILGAQYRTHLFMVLIVEKYARLIRWDRSGAVVTEPIYFNKEPHLFNFLIHYDIADPEARGHDSTVGLPTEAEIRCAKAAVRELAKAKYFLAVTISDQQSNNRYIICRAKIRPFIPVGRWTRPSVAFDTQNRRRVLLKDSWRVLLDGIKPEGEIYGMLHKKGVSNIPSCLVAGDVGKDAHHRSLTHDVIGKHVASHPCWKLTPHRHYRIVLGLVGRRLENFERTRDVVHAMSAALLGKLPIFH
jgi:hypothetical protein